MALVRRANVRLEVKDEDVERYLNKGFNLIDSSGSIVREAIPHDVEALRRAFFENKATIEKLEAEIAELKAELAKKATVTRTRKKSTEEEVE